MPLLKDEFEYYKDEYKIKITDEVFEFYISPKKVLKNIDKYENVFREIEFESYL